MKKLVARILASAAQKMWNDDATLGRYTAETREHEPNLTFPFAVELRDWFSWLDVNFDVIKPNVGRRRPDLIFHRRQTHRLNFLVVEVKRGRDLAGARKDLRKIKRFWFRDNLHYRFGASVILGERHGSFKIRVLERNALVPTLRISNRTAFQALNTPQYSRVRRHTLRTIADSVANGQVQENILDDTIFHLYGN